MINSTHEILSQTQIFKSQIQNVWNLNIKNCDLAYFAVVWTSKIASQHNHAITNRLKQAFQATKAEFGIWPILRSCGATATEDGCLEFRIFNDEGAS